MNKATQTNPLGWQEPVPATQPSMPTHISVAIREVLERALPVTDDPPRVVRRALPVQRPRRALAGTVR